MSLGMAVPLAGVCDPLSLPGSSPPVKAQALHACCYVVAHKWTEPAVCLLLISSFGCIFRQKGSASQALSELCRAASCVIIWRNAGVLPNPLNPEPYQLNLE